MHKKIIFIIFLVVCLGMLGYMIFINNILDKNEEIISEYVPEVEISDNELRKTIVTLYFKEKDQKNIKSEARLVDSKELLREPYKVLIGMLVEGPKDSKLETAIPENTKVLKTELKGSTVIIDLSEEFINQAPEEEIEKSNMIYSIVNTLTELKEVDSVKFLINGEEVNGFDEDGINLTSEFVRKN